ncbi:MFS transporter [Burkholderiaceae bacterium DAT-1]|nr:MFS transporter [Burkholderiaceae bacterium DAT-1]
MHTTSPPTRPPSPFGNRNFRWLVAGGIPSMLGDQFTQMALPWLVLKLTGDPLILGLVLSLISLPRAVFILLGGAVVDRYSPKHIFLATKLINMSLIGVLAVLVISGSITLHLIYVLALLIGLATAFSYPAGSSLMPLCMPADLLQPANGILMGLRQMSLLLGPAMAGGLIAVFGNDVVHGQTGLFGIGIAFAIDACCYGYSAWTLSHVVIDRAADHAPTISVWRSIGDGLRMFWQDTELRTLCLYFAIVSFFVGGPIQVALPVMANTRLDHGAASLGWLLTAHGAGTLLGMVMSGIKPNLRLRTLGATILAIDAIAGLAFIPFGHIATTAQGMMLLAPLGVLAGFVQVAVFTWMQRRVPPQMMGRAMSIFMFILMGVAPLASSLAGAALHVLTPTELFTGSGIILMIIAITGMLFTPMTRVGSVEDAPASA